MMRTTLDVDPELLERALAITGEKSKGRAVNRALEELVRRDAIERLLALRGKLDLKANWEKWEEEELEAEEEHKRNRAW